jgi:2-polyprenyl-3-methyl-5-hydroxy-6-metoxy-1,4-benzoquinol methylase
LKEFWDERYAENELAYGEQPNTFVKEYLQGKNPGTILFPAEGQGRNAIFAARLGWKVDAFDYSPVARKRALDLAQQVQVSINYFVQDMLEYEPPELKYDVIFLCYIHLKPEWRSIFYPQLLKALKPKGVLVMEAFTKTQLAYQHLSGGPANEMLLYTADIVRKDFQDLDEVYLEEMKTELNEGKYHVGPAHIIRYIGRKQPTK